MPLTDKGQKVMDKMKKEYGDDKGERVFYATITKNKNQPGNEPKTWEKITAMRRRRNGRI